MEEQPRQPDRVATVGLDLVPGASRDERWCDDRTLEAHRADQAMEPVSPRPRLLAESDPLVLRGGCRREAEGGDRGWAGDEAIGIDG